MSKGHVFTINIFGEEILDVEENIFEDDEPVLGWDSAPPRVGICPTDVLFRLSVTLFNKNYTLTIERDCTHG